MGRKVLRRITQSRKVAKNGKSNLDRMNRIHQISLLRMNPAFYILFIPLILSKMPLMFSVPLSLKRSGVVNRRCRYSRLFAANRLSLRPVQALSRALRLGVNPIAPHCFLLSAQEFHQIRHNNPTAALNLPLFNLSVHSTSAVDFKGDAL
jgi:hypothetical protein